MAKFCGAVGYCASEEKVPGVWVETITEHTYFGDILKNVGQIRDGQNLNPDIVSDNRISIVADPFAYTNFQSMRYVKWMGVSWKITSVDVQRPRLILSIGGVYNG